MKNMRITTTIILISAITIIMFILWFTGVIGLWFNGMAYIANNTKEFNDTEGHLIPDKYSISINLDDLKSNIGKELYNDGKSKIYVSWIDSTGSSNTGGYRIGFRSSGQYSLNSATLISGAHHETVTDNSFRTDMTAEMTVKYKEKIYKSSEFGTSGLNYRDGDDFAFYVFPSEAYDNGEVTLNEKGIAELSIKNLYKNIWTKN
ncbi:MAG: hypothetical protein Q8865_09435 [Bacillota bacterium]|nr:hypothetical protein [Bacillota bacterium]